jgi:hypothetical protein
VPLPASARELAYRAPAGCPSQDEVARRLSASGSEGRAAVIDVRRNATGFSGELVLGEGDMRLVRKVDARTCAAVVEALALVVALDREPASGEPAPGDAPDPPGEVAREAAAEPPAPVIATPTSASPREEPAHRPSPGDGNAHVVVALGAAVSGTSFALGSVLPGATVFFGLASSRGLGDSAWLRPSARLSFGQTLSTTTASSGVIPEFTLTAASLDVCPISLRVASRLGIVACGRAEVGALTAGAAGDGASATSRLWQGAGALARAQWVLTTSSGARPMIELGGGILAPLQRDRFHFGADASAEPVTAPPILWTLALGVGVVLP